ncbi:FmdB family zinc ribbon protein [Desulfatirhabdium butyrativorans]|uniref:FmdB family zinc ribbon protein n=1 Tax=Desulfatirhabdium butyrativorans TaxID=340467 RepID=UPI00041D6F2D|nr:FmdB family zinc ribbon protein [Desulfatirhabdium butyrativorans]
MPIYEYECTQCGQIEEVLQKFSDEPLTTCKKCSGKLHKLISQSSFHLKGTGWYVTDYASGSKPSASKPAAKDVTETKTDTPAKESTSKE